MGKCLLSSVNGMCPAYRATLLPIRWALEHDRNPSSVCVTELNPRGTKYPLTLVLAQI